VKNSTKIIVAGLGVSLVLGGIVSYWASSHPDGLEWVAEEKGFKDTATENETQKELAPIPDYAAPGVENDFLKVSIAGVVGTLITFAVALGIAWLIKKRKQPAAA
jgi:hypothetical protein